MLNVSSFCITAAAGTELARTFFFYNVIIKKNKKDLQLKKP